MVLVENWFTQLSSTVSDAIPTGTTKLGRTWSAFYYVGAQLWNNLPVSVKRAKNVETFKSASKTHFFREYY